MSFKNHELQNSEQLYYIPKDHWNISDSELGMFLTILQDSSENAVKFFTGIKTDRSGGRRHKIQQG